MPSYRLDWQEGHGLQTDPEPLCFNAVDDQAAIKRAAEASGAQLKEGKLTAQAFSRAGGEALYEGTRKVFPT